MFSRLFRETDEPQVSLWEQHVQRPTACTLQVGEFNVVHFGCRKIMQVKGVHMKELGVHSVVLVKERSDMICSIHQENHLGYSLENQCLGPDWLHGGQYITTGQSR